MLLSYLIIIRELPKYVYIFLLAIILSNITKYARKNQSIIISYIKITRKIVGKFLTTSSIGITK